MKLIKQSVELIPQIEYKCHIDKCARVCYKSEGNYDPDKSEEFVQKLIKMKHLAMLEHGTICLFFPRDCDDFDELYEFYTREPHSMFETTKQGLYVTTNYRVLVENDLADLQYMVDPATSISFEPRYTMHIVTSIGIVRELLRHRKFSFANESTRYCNYSKDKFNNELTFIIPSWLNISEGKISTKPTILGEEREVKTFIDDDGMPTTIWEYDEPIQKGGYYSDDIFISDDYNDQKWLFIRACEKAEDSYRAFQKYSPQQAREVLPLCTKSELIMTGFKRDWEDFLDKRLKESTGKVHPDMKQLAEMINDKLNLI